jgi:hypothetical protein
MGTECPGKLKADIAKVKARAKEILDAEGAIQRRLLRVRRSPRRTDGRRNGAAQPARRLNASSSAVVTVP